MRKETLLVSACLMGACVRYNGKSKALSNSTLQGLSRRYFLLGVCPEMLGGLPCPRAPSEISNDGKHVFNSDEEDVTLFFKRGAHECLNICKNYRIRRALFKSLSPSCGKGLIYDGTFSGRVRPGDGFTTHLLRQEGIEVYSEEEINKLTDTNSKGN